MVSRIPSDTVSNPRPQAPEACALSRLGYPPLTLSRHQTEIINYGLWLQKEGYSPHIIYNDVKRLRRFDKHCEILNPEAAKRHIANSNWNSGGKQHICEVLDRCHLIQWTRPCYQQVESLPWIPHTEEVDALINGLGNPRIATFVHAAKDTGQEAENCGNYNGIK